MRAYHLLLPVVIFAINTPAAGQEQVPAVLRDLKPHQIIEAVIAETQTLSLSAGQAARLDSLHWAVRNEPHRYAIVPSPKAHRARRMRPMISKQRAYAQALAMLTPLQRERARTRFADPLYRLPKQLTPSRAPAQDRDPLQHHVGNAGAITHPVPKAQSGKPE